MDLQLPMQSVPITTKVEISNPAQGEVHLIQHYVATNKIERLDITEILLKVVLNILILIWTLFHKISVIIAEKNSILHW